MAEELLPEGLYMGKDTQRLVVSCAQEFVHMLTFQANEICQKETRNGYISLQHVVKACEELGFAEYAGEIQAVSNVYDQQLKSSQRVRSPSHFKLLEADLAQKRAERVGWWTKGTSLDELAVLQAQMLENSKARFEQRLAEERNTPDSTATP